MTHLGIDRRVYSEPDSAAPLMAAGNDAGSPKKGARTPSMPLFPPGAWIFYLQAEENYKEMVFPLFQNSSCQDDHCCSAKQS